MKFLSVLWFAALLQTFGVAASTAQLPGPRLASPVEPITAIIEAFRSHSVVALGEGLHGNEQGHAFRLALIRDPRFAATVNDVVVEFGNARYQDVMDRFVHGEDVSHEALQQAWQDTTVPNPVWDRRIYEDFFRAVREVNGSMPRQRQLRVLLGDSPIDWARVKTTQDYERLEDRDRHAVNLIQREVLAKQRRALVIYGDMHFQRKPAFFNYELSDAPGGRTIVSLLEASAVQPFTIWTNTLGDLAKLQSDVASWAKPSLVMLRGTIPGAADFVFYNPVEGARFPVRTGRTDFSAPIPREQWRSLPMEEQFDAVLYVGPPSEISIAPLTSRVCSDSNYLQMRLTRMTLAGFPPADTERLRKSCATLAPK